MSHPLGSLARDLTQVLRYQVGNQAVGKGLTLAAQGRFEEAAGQFKVGADVAKVLADATESSDPDRAARWRRVEGVRRSLCAQAREASLESAIPVQRRTEVLVVTDAVSA